MPCFEARLQGAPYLSGTSLLHEPTGGQKTKTASTKGNGTDWMAGFNDFLEGYGVFFIKGTGSCSWEKPDE